MARISKPAEFASRRNEILDAAQRLVLTKGYEQMSIQDVLDEVQISSGAFHHYFGSRAALLEAFIERIKVESEKPLLPILHDPRLTAIQKLQGFFDTLDSLRTAHQAEVVQLGKVWYTDDNAVVRLKVAEAVIEMRAPLLSEVVRQGVREGVFNNAYADRAGEVILALLQGMGDTHARLLQAIAVERDDARVAGLVADIVTVHAAYMDAVERVLGAPEHALYRADAATVWAWVSALREAG